MYVEFNIPHVYLLSNRDIPIALRPTTLKLPCELVCILVWRDFQIFLIIYISLGVLVSESVKPVKFVLNIIYLSSPLRTKSMDRHQMEPC